MYIERLKEMFQNVFIKKNASKIPEYYHKDFLLYTNGQEMDYLTFLNLNQRYAKAPITYQIEYDDDTFVELENKVACRLWINTCEMEDSSEKIEVMLIVEYFEDKIHRLWEVTFPDWKTLPIFRRY